MLFSSTLYLLTQESPFRGPHSFTTVFHRQYYILHPLRFFKLYIAFFTTFRITQKHLAISLQSATRDTHGLPLAPNSVRGSWGRKEPEPCVKPQLGGNESRKANTNPDKTRQPAPSL